MSRLVGLLSAAGGLVGLLVLSACTTTTSVREPASAASPAVAGASQIQCWAKAHYAQDAKWIKRVSMARAMRDLACDDGSSYASCRKEISDQIGTPEFKQGFAGFIHQLDQKDSNSKLIANKLNALQKRADHGFSSLKNELLSVLFSDETVVMNKSLSFKNDREMGHKTDGGDPFWDARFVSAPKNFRLTDVQSAKTEFAPLAATEKFEDFHRVHQLGGVEVVEPATFDSMPGGFRLGDVSTFTDVSPTHTLNDVYVLSYVGELGNGADFLLYQDGKKSLEFRIIGVRSGSQIQPIAQVLANTARGKTMIQKVVSQTPFAADGATHQIDPVQMSMKMTTEDGRKKSTVVSTLEYLCR